MKQRMLFATAVTLVVIGVGGEAAACGDKFLVVGRGARFQRGYVAIHPGSLLLVDTRRSGNDLLLPLRRAGHRVDVVHDSGQLRRALAGTNYDVVLSDWSSASEIQPLVTSVAPTALFVPVVNGGSKTEVTAVTKLYGCPLQSKKQKADRGFLARLDDVIDARRKSKPLKCDID